MTDSSKYIAGFVSLSLVANLAWAGHVVTDAPELPDRIPIAASSSTASTAPSIFAAMIGEDVRVHSEPQTKVAGRLEVLPTTLS